MANQRKPTRLKLIQGTDRKDRHTPEVELPPVAESPDPPDWLINAFAIHEWDRLGRILAAHQLLTEADLSTLGHLCNLHGKIVQLYTAGETPTASMLSTLRNLQTDFGLSPVARGKVSAAGEPLGQSDNPFASNGRPAPVGKKPAPKKTPARKSPAKKKTTAKKKPATRKKPEPTKSQ